MIKEQQNQNKEDENDLYLIPNRKIVSYKILEAYYNMVETFSQLTNNNENKGLLKSMNKYITNLYFLIKDYKHITEKLDAWEDFAGQIESAIDKGNMKFNYNGLAKITKQLTSAVYQSGLTKIEWEEEEFDELEDFRQHKTNQRY